MKPGFAAALFALALTGAPASAQPLPRAAQADRLVLTKSDRTLVLYWHGAPLKAYRIALGTHPDGPKLARGDRRTPEGTYTLMRRRKPTEFHGALVLSYPNPDDLARARAAGVAPGGGIEIHGLRDGFEWLGSAHTIFDWTDGCIAVTNREMDELLRAVPDGTPIEIRP